MIDKSADAWERRRDETKDRCDEGKGEEMGRKAELPRGKEKRWEEISNEVSCIKETLSQDFLKFLS